MDDTTNNHQRFELKNLRLRVYKLIVLMLGVLYLDDKYQVLGGKDVWEILLMTLIGVAILGEVLKFFDSRKESKEQ